MSIQRDQTYRIDTRKPQGDEVAAAEGRTGRSSSGDDKRKPLALICGAILLVAAACFFLLRGPSSAVDIDHPTGFHFVCGNGHAFTLTESDLRDYKANHLGEPIKCPKCGDTHVRQADAPPRAAGKK
jgi:hypothetical protein